MYLSLYEKRNIYFLEKTLYKGFKNCYFVPLIKKRVLCTPTIG